MGDERTQKKVLNGKFHNARPVGKQEQDGRTSSGGTHRRSLEYEGGGNEQKTEKNGGVFRGRPGSRRGCSAIDGMEG